MSVKSDVPRAVHRPLNVMPGWAYALAAMALLSASARMVDAHGAYWGWEISHFHLGFSQLGDADLLAALQAGSMALLLDQTFRRLFRFVNRHAGVNIPTLVGQMVSMLICAILSLVFYKLYFRVDLDALLAMSGVMLLGVSYLLKDTIDDVLCSVQIQADNSISVGDWLAIDCLEKDQLYLFKQLDRRMVMLESHSGCARLIRASDFYKFNIVNMSRQPLGHSRKIAIGIDLCIPEDGAIQVVRHAVESLVKEKADWVMQHTIGLEDVAMYRYELYVEYSCKPHVPIALSNSAIRQRVLKYLRCAGFVDQLSPVASLPAGLTVERFGEVPVRRVLPGFNILNTLLGLKDYGVLSPLSQEDLMLLAKEAQLCHFKPGDPVLSMGELDDHLLLISQGQLVVTPVTNRAMPSKLTLSPGECVGEMGFFTGKPRSADVHALTHAVVVRLPRSGFQAIMDHNDSIAHLLATMIKDRSAEMLQSPENSGQEELSVNSLSSKILAFFGLKRSASAGMAATP